MIFFNRLLWVTLMAAFVALPAVTRADDDLLLEDPPAEEAGGDDLLLEDPPANEDSGGDDLLLEEAPKKDDAGDDLLLGDPPADTTPKKPAKPSAPAPGAAVPSDTHEPTGIIRPEEMHYHPDIDPLTDLTIFDPALFSADPTYEGEPYDYQAQLDIYGAKYLNPTQRPLIEWNRQLYQFGPFQPAATPFGETNPVFPQFLMYGDYRTAVAYNDNGETEQATWAHRLNLELDFKITDTERVHVFMRPLDKNGNFTRYDFSGEEDGFELQLDGNIDALFFEGDLGSIVGGFTGVDSQFDMPFALGLMPLLFQNGIWVEDAFTGVAATIPAQNSRELDWSNFDITFFAGLDRVTTRAFGDSNDADIFGVTAFIETMQGYWEVGYGYTHDTDGRGRSYHNVTAAFTRRYGAFISNSVRWVGNFGQDPDNGPQLADGHIILIENSLITSSPSTFVPYFNFFIGFDRPQSLARAADAGGILKNTGINFETDGLTGFPKLDDTAGNTWGFATGVNLLGANFENQIVLEFAYAAPHASASDSAIPGEQYAVGVRYQHPLTNALILRADAMYGWRDDQENLSGMRLELRYKF